MQQRFFKQAGFQKLKAYYISVVAGYLLVPLSFAYMTHSFVGEGFNPSTLQLPREEFFAQMLKVSILAGCAAIPLFALWLGFLLQRAGVYRNKLDVFFASAHIGVPVFFFVLGWLNLIH